MPNYAKVYASILKRALSQADLDLETFVADALESGMSAQAIEERLLNDVQTGGPVFGKFMQSLEGGAAKTVIAAKNQGAYLAQVVEDDAALARLERIAGVGKSEAYVSEVLRTGDAEALADIEAATEDIVVERSVAELVNTCPVCLPLHGVTMTRREWREKGLLPEQRHAGWTSVCHCLLIPAELAAPRSDLAAPLVRTKLEGVEASKNIRKTVRAIASGDLDRGVKAVARASETAEGRRLLSLLGQVKGG